MINPAPEQPQTLLSASSGDTALDPVPEQGIENPTRAGRGDRDHDAIERGLERLHQATLGH